MRAGWVGWVVGLVVAALVAACGGGADLSKARIRLVNASGGYAALDLTVDDSRRFASVAYGETANYAEVDPDKMASTISRPGSATVLLSFTPGVRKDRNFTVLAWGAEGALRSLVLDDNTGEPADNKTLLRVINTAADAGPVDVYLTGSSDTLADAVPLQAAAAVGTLGGFATVNSGNWRLRVTAANDKGDLRLDVPVLALGSRQVTTLVITPGRGGVLVNALLLVDRGGIARADNTLARVRVAATVPGGGAVTAAAGATPLLAGVGAPVVGAYTAVTADGAALSASVNGVAATGTAATLAAGADYTLLVWGPLAAPRATLIEDDNRAPTAAGQAKLRLVNGLADLTTPLSLAVGLSPVGGAVGPGAASAYGSFGASTTADLEARAAGQASAVAASADRTLAAGGVYTYFVVGNLADRRGELQQDR